MCACANAIFHENVLYSKNQKFVFPTRITKFVFNGNPLVLKRVLLWIITVHPEILICLHFHYDTQFIFIIVLSLDLCILFHYVLSFFICSILLPYLLEPFEIVRFTHPLDILVTTRVLLFYAIVVHKFLICLVLLC